MTDAKSSFGTLLQLGDAGSPEAFTTVAEVLDLGGPEMSVDEEDVTNHSSPNAMEEVIATIKRAGEITFDVNFIPTHATHNQTTGLLAVLKNRQTRNWRIVLTDAGPSRWQLAAFVKNWAGSSPVAGVQRASVTLRVTGEPVLV